jgi:hypothetical protein
MKLSEILDALAALLKSPPRFGTVGILITVHDHEFVKIEKTVTEKVAAEGKDAKK